MNKNLPILTITKKETIYTDDFYFIEWIEDGQKRTDKMVAESILKFIQKGFEFEIAEDAGIESIELMYMEVCTTDTDGLYDVYEHEAYVDAEEGTYNCMEGKFIRTYKQEASAFNFARKQKPVLIVES